MDRSALVGLDRVSPRDPFASFDDAAPSLAREVPVPTPTTITRHRVHHAPVRGGVGLEAGQFQLAHAHCRRAGCCCLHGRPANAKDALSLQINKTDANDASAWHRWFAQGGYGRSRVKSRMST